MGYALAESAVMKGAEVTLISGPTTLSVPQSVKMIRIETVDQLQSAVSSEIGKADCLIMAAAPADFKPAYVATQKIKKKGTQLPLELEPTVDILKSLSDRQRYGRLLVGFALETENGLANAKKKLKEKNLDLIVLNQPSEKTGFSTDTNEVTIIATGSEPLHLSLGTKREIAGKVLDYIAVML